MEIIFYFITFFSEYVQIGMLDETVTSYLAFL